MTSAQPDPRPSWDRNAAAWTAVVRAGGIASRRLATDTAIVDAVLALNPDTALDLGCGEGWLARALADRGVEVTGVDAAAALVDEARTAGGGAFHVLSYEEIAADPARLGGPFDVVAANFALLHQDLAPLLRALRRAVAPGGRLVVQTVHPLAMPGPYADGWRTEDFRGFGEGNWAPMPWYFRTLSSWVDALRDGGWRLETLAEPTHPEVGAPLSLLLVAGPG